MKATITILFAISVLLAGCEKDENNFSKNLTDGFCIVSNDKVVIKHTDIEFYDYSTHLIYLNDNKSFADDIEGIGNFTVYADRHKIYSGQTFSHYSSYMPSGAVIRTQPSFYGDNILSIDFVSRLDSSGNYLPDPREDKKIVNALKKYNQFHAGLSCEIKSLSFLSSNNVKLELLLKNNDSFNYYYIDPEKTGIGLFHYFTTGLLITGFSAHKTYTHKTATISADPWNGWKKDWLSVIRGKESKVITITYDNYDNVPQGKYKAIFEFPGLSFQVEKKDIQQDNGQIWLGKLNIRKDITKK